VVSSEKEKDMKNNRLTNGDLAKLRMAAERIRLLASLEQASFSVDEKKDAEIKEEIRPYMMWFTNIACNIDRLLDGQEVDYLYFR